MHARWKDGGVPKRRRDRALTSIITICSRSVRQAKMDKFPMGISRSIANAAHDTDKAINVTEGIVLTFSGEGIRIVLIGYHLH